MRGISVAASPEGRGGRRRRKESNARIELLSTPASRASVRNLSTSYRYRSTDSFSIDDVAYANARGKESLFHGRSPPDTLCSNYAANITMIYASVVALNVGSSFFLFYFFLFRRSTYCARLAIVRKFSRRDSQGTIIPMFFPPPPLRMEDHACRVCRIVLFSRNFAKRERTLNITERESRMSREMNKLFGIKLEMIRCLLNYYSSPVCRTLACGKREYSPVARRVIQFEISWKKVRNVLTKDFNKTF